MSDQQPPPPPDQPQQPYGQQGFGQQPQYGEQQPYQPYPEDSARREFEAYQASMTSERPSSIKNAVLLMRIGAGLSALGVVFVLVTLDSYKDDLRKSFLDNDSSLSSSQLDTQVNISVSSAVIFGVLGVLLWLWMAAKNNQGRNWARITATVLGALNILSSLFGLTAGVAVATSSNAIGVITSILNLLIAAVAIFFMYRKDASAYYAAMSRR